MRCVSLLAVAFGATVLLPPIAVAQDCAGAIAAVDQKLQKPQHSDNWNRIQVRLYVAEQLLADNERQKCLKAVREAEKIAGLQVNPETGASSSAQTADPPEEASAEGAGPDKNRSPGGANIQGLNAEGWGSNEAEAVPAPDEQ